jgi:hypothetical protein
MACEMSNTDLHAYLDGKLDAAGIAGFEQHLKTCAECAARLAVEESLRRSLQQGSTPRKCSGIHPPETQFTLEHGAGLRSLLHLSLRRFRDGECCSPRPLTLCRKLRGPRLCWTRTFALCNPVTSQMWNPLISIPSSRGLRESWTSRHRCTISQAVDSLFWGATRRDGRTDGCGAGLREAKAHCEPVRVEIPTACPFPTSESGARGSPTVEEPLPAILSVSSGALWRRTSLSPWPRIWP